MALTIFPTSGHSAASTTMKLTSALAVAALGSAVASTPDPPCERKLFLYDASVEPALELTQISDGSTVYLSDYGVTPSEITLLYEGCDNPASASFWVKDDAGWSQERCEDYAPFTIAANSGPNFSTWNAKPYLDEIELKVAEHSQDGCKWKERTEVTKIKFTLIPESAMVPVRNCPEDDNGGDPSRYNMCLDLLVYPEDEAVFLAARDTWLGKITGDITPVSAPLGTSRACSGYPATIDDLYLCGSYEYMDGRSGVLGYAGISYRRTSGPDSGLPISGYMSFDSADIQTLKNQGRFDSVIIHEMGQ